MTTAHPEDDNDLFLAVAVILWLCTGIGAFWYVPDLYAAGLDLLFVRGALPATGALLVGIGLTAVALREGVTFLVEWRLGRSDDDLRINQGDV